MCKDRIKPPVAEARKIQSRESHFSLQPRISTSTEQHSKACNGFSITHYFKISFSRKFALSQIAVGSDAKVQGNPGTSVYM